MKQNCWQMCKSHVQTESKGKDYETKKKRTTRDKTIAREKCSKRWQEVGNAAMAAALASWNQEDAMSTAKTWDLKAFLRFAQVFWSNPKRGGRRFPLNSKLVSAPSTWCINNKICAGLHESCVVFFLKWGRRGKKTKRESTNSDNIELHIMLI